ncbi:MAG: cell wall hydrolase [Lachnospiraceae bacterium]
MYKKYAMLLLLCNLVFVMGLCCIRVAQRSRYASMPAFQMMIMDEMADLEETSRQERMKTSSSGQRVIDYQVMEREARYDATDEEREILCRIVEAEAGGEGLGGKMLVAGVVLNRVENEKFPDTIKEVVFQRDHGICQFSPVRDGRYQKVKISEETEEAVDRALMGEDYSRGALYFVSRKSADPEKMKWFDRHLRLLYVYGGHEFFS